MLSIEKAILSKITDKPQTLNQIVRKANPRAMNNRSKSDWFQAAQKVVKEHATRTYNELGEAFYTRA